MPVDVPRASVATAPLRVVARARRWVASAWTRWVEAWAAWQVASGRHGTRSLASVVRHAELEHLRQVIDAALRGSASRFRGRVVVPEEAERQRLPTDASGLPVGSLAADAGFAQAVLMASYATATSLAALEATSGRASRRIVRAGIDRLVRERRFELAWALIRMRTDVALGQAQLAQVVPGGASPADLVALADGAVAILPWLKARDRASIAALAAVESGRRALATGAYVDADGWFTKAMAVGMTPVVLTWSARAAVLVGDLDRASDLVSRALSEHDSWAPAWRVQARLHELAGDGDLAASSWLTVATAQSSTDADLVAAYEGLGRLGRLEEQAEVAARLVTSTDGRPDAHARRAAVLWRQGARPQAERMVEGYAEATNALALRALALYLGRTRRSPEAYLVLSRMSIFTRGPGACAELVRALHDDGHHRLAEQARDRALAVFTDGAAGHQIRSATSPFW